MWAYVGVGGTVQGCIYAYTGGYYGGSEPLGHTCSNSGIWDEMTQIPGLVINDQSGDLGDMAYVCTWACTGGYIRGYSPYMGLCGATGAHMVISGIWVSDDQYHHFGHSGQSGDLGDVGIWLHEPLQGLIWGYMWGYSPLYRARDTHVGYGCQTTKSPDWPGSMAGQWESLQTTHTSMAEP